MPKRKRKFRTFDYTPEPIITMENLQVSLDGGATWIPAREIRLKAADSEVANEVHYTVTNEGVKAEVVSNNEVLGTEMKYHYDIIADLE